MARGSIGGGALSDVEVPSGPPVVPLVSLATILSGFEINNIGVQARISSAVTLPPCSTCFACGSEQSFASFATDKISFWRTWLFDGSLSC